MSSLTSTLTLAMPDDWHLHLRDGDALKTTVPHTAQRFGRAIVMPNLTPPMTTVTMAEDYRHRIIAAVPDGMPFNPLMTLYLTDNMSTDEINRANDTEHMVAVKYYPAGATTNSDAGATRLENTYPVLEVMQRFGMPLLVHGEVTDPDVDIFDREKVFIDRCLIPLMKQLPKLKIVFEHITTKEAIEFVNDGPDTLAATITAHHLLLNRNDFLAGGIKPHYYCLPVLKREPHRQALIEAATKGSSKFFLGTDSAPHEQARKESACACAGIYTAHAGIELYAQIFEQADALDKLEGFASFHGADFYQQPRSTKTITLVKTAWTVPASYPFTDGQLVPFLASQRINWSLSL